LNSALGGLVSLMAFSLADLDSEGGCLPERGLKKHVDEPGHRCPLF
jgi:hypothetical protein